MSGPSRAESAPVIRRDEIVRLTRLWCGTPYHHQASELGVGTDCLGLVRGVWRALYNSEPEALPGYTRDWAEASGTETLVEAARRHLIEIPREKAAAGDILVFRLRPWTAAKHAAILVSSDSMVHAVEGAPVSEVVLSGWWRRRIAAAFQFPGILI